MKMKDIRLNMLINAIKGLLSVLFPFITFPYITRVLQTECVGQFNFASSIVSYFILIAGLGIATYASCEGPKYREDPHAINKFVSEIFSINVLSSILSYVLLLLSIIFIDKLQGYTALILVLSIQIAFQTLGKEWLCSIYEDYSYLAVRYVFFQVFSIVALFVFVKDTGDCLVYTAIVAISGTGANIANYFRVRSFCNVKFVMNRAVLKHLKPILVFFATALAITVYVNSDMTILGFLGTDRDVGIYSVSVKIYLTIKSVLASAVAVVIPRMAAMSAQKDRKGIERTAREVFEIAFTVTMPVLIGTIVVAEEIVLIIAGVTYMEASLSLKILSVALFFCIWGYFWGQCVLYPYRQESVVFRGTVFSALVNVVLNLFLIPVWKQNAAAFTTILSEALASLISFWAGRKIVKISGMGIFLLKTLAGCAGIVAVDMWIEQMNIATEVRILCTIVCAVVAYTTIEIMVKNSAVYSAFESIKQKVLHK